MNFRLRIDETARAGLPAAELRRSGVELGDADLHVSLGDELDLRAPIDAVAGAKPMPDPRPAVYLPRGVSAAVEKLGKDTLAVAGAHDGLVVVDFTREVEARTRPPAHAPGAEQAVEQSDVPDSGQALPEGQAADKRGTVRLRHLVLSLEDPDGFVKAVGARKGVRPVT